MHHGLLKCVRDSVAVASACALHGNRKFTASSQVEDAHPVTLVLHFVMAGIVDYDGWNANAVPSRLARRQVVIGIGPRVVCLRGV